MLMRDTPRMPRAVLLCRRYVHVSHAPPVDAAHAAMPYLHTPRLMPMRVKGARDAATHVSMPLMFAATLPFRYRAMLPPLLPRPMPR